jgi:hypothetical protein
VAAPRIGAARHDEQRLVNQAGVAQAGDEQRESEIQFLLQQLPAEFGVGPRHRRHIDIRILAGEIGERPARQRISEDAVQADLDMAALQRLIGHHFVQRARSGVPDALGTGEQLPPEFGQGHAARFAFEQRQAEQVFQRANRPADARLGQVQLCRCLADAAQLRGDDEMVEVLHLHGLRLSAMNVYP